MKILNGSAENVFGRFYIQISDKIMIPSNQDPAVSAFRIDGVPKLTYVGFHDDFGPMSLSTVYNFCSIVDEQLKLTSKNIAMHTKSECRALTNAVFLVGAYMIMKLWILEMRTINLHRSEPSSRHIATCHRGRSTSRCMFGTVGMVCGRRSSCSG